ncbi:MAG: hypothetical protein FWB80_05270 [Defluviitaleaceae bacterium]|nr:hypothetical protein [Defluviitaleaceae bacterium]
MIKKTIIRRSPISTVLLAVMIMGFAAFSIGCTYALIHVTEGIGETIFTIALMLFGAGMVYYLLPDIWRPIVIISNEGITIPYGYGNKVDFIPWYNVRKLEILDKWIVGATNNRYIAVFAHKPEDVKFATKNSKNVAIGLFGNRPDVPALVISTSLTFVKTKKIMDVLQTYRR